MSVSAISALWNNMILFERIMTFLDLDLADIPQASRVCKSWNDFIKNNALLWRTLSEKEGISIVEGEDRDRKEDFKILYPRFVSGKKIGGLFGKVIGPIPPISEKDFNELAKEDPFEKGELMQETFVFVVRPDKVARTSDQDTPLTLNASNELESIEKPTGEVLEIPFSLRNHKMLCSYPLSGKENMPVFDKDSDSDVFEQCDTYPNKVTVYFMRKQVSEQSRKKTYTTQEELVKTQGFEVTPLSIRALSDSVEILTSGTCSDNRNPWTYARTSDVVRYGSNAYQSVIGGFAPRAGVRVD